MQYQDYELAYRGQSNPDVLGTISVSIELYDKHKNRDGDIVIGGGFNGSYHLWPLDEESPSDCGIDTLSELVETIQGEMGYDGGAYVSLNFLSDLAVTPAEMQEILDAVKLPILKYSGEQPGSHEINARRQALLLSTILETS